MTAERADTKQPILRLENLTVSYGTVKAVRNISFDVEPRAITAIIGPSGCGKSTLIRAFNRMNEFIPDVKTEGAVYYHSKNIYGRDIDVVDVRRRIGMVFQKPNPFPKSIFQNVAWGPHINGYKGSLHERVEHALQRAALWDEVKDKLSQSGLSLSGGQQQRLCIARAIAMEPEIILMDEPCSALDPISTGRIEDLLFELKKRYTIVMVTHNMQQAARVSDATAFMYQGDLIEFGPTPQIFTRPTNRQTEDYVTGKFG
ncbi:MAG TPA: phosphate ABC transporter ATP-binding protein PstB [Bdellovibrionota bacterium]|nr:phosphate ABC transporter ATP-binding protein PstB [Bdellovibrionota bacterium]